MRAFALSCCENRGIPKHRQKTPERIVPIEKKYRILYDLVSFFVRIVGIHTYQDRVSHSYISDRTTPIQLEAPGSHPSSRTCCQRAIHRFWVESLRVVKLRFAFYYSCWCGDFLVAVWVCSTQFCRKAESSIPCKI